MLDSSFFAERFNELEAGLKKRNASLDLLDQLKALSQQKKQMQLQVETLKAQRNQAAQAVAELKAKSKTDPEAARLAEEKIKSNRELGEQIKTMDSALSEVTQKLDSFVMVIPNLTHETVPAGASSDENKEVKSWGKPKALSFTPKDHADLGVALGLLDFEKGSLLSGARFTVLTGAGAQLSRAIAQFMLDHHTVLRGYQEVNPPLLVTRKTMTGTGNLPKFEQDLFKTQVDDRELFLIPTAEVSLTNLYAGSILDGSQLPIHLTAHTPCFRSEAGSYGKDVKGLIRQHQFEKVELVKFSKPEESMNELESMVSDAEAILEALELPYRRMLLCAGDMGFSATKTYDLEVWIPSQSMYREISSCSNCWDFQARRAQIRYREKPEDKPRLLHTLNGSGLAVGRTWVALIENGQQEDGSILLPKALTPYLEKFVGIKHAHFKGKFTRDSDRIRIVS